jgi:hypothetical protein
MKYDIAKNNYLCKYETQNIFIVAVDICYVV